MSRINLKALHPCGCGREIVTTHDRVRAALRVSVTLSLLLVMFFSSPVKADGEEDRPSFSCYTDVLSQYIWRGYASSKDSAVIQPSVTASYKGLSINIWGNFDTDSKFKDNPSAGAKWNETDFTVAYSRSIYERLSGSVGCIYYDYGLDSTFGTNVDDLVEIYAGLSYAFPWLNVGVTGYREVTHAPGWTIQFDFSRTFTLPWYGMSTNFDLSLFYLHSLDNAAYPNPSNPEEAFSGFMSGELLAVLNIPVWKSVTLSPRIGYAFPLSHSGSQEITLLSWDSRDWHIFGGVRISAAF